jgi:hypothetical protein
MNSIKATDELAEDDYLSQSYLLNRNFIFNQTYRFAYKDKLFPKLATEYPIYKIT